MVARALASSVIAGDGDSFVAGTGMTSTSCVQASLLVGSGANVFVAQAVGSLMEVTLPADAVGCPVSIGFSLKQGQTATFEIKVNGVVHGSLVLPVTSVANRWSGSVYRIPASALPSGATVRATCTAQSGVNIGAIDFFQLESRTPTTPVIVMGTNRFPGNAGLNDADVADANTKLRAMVASFAQADGRNHVRFIDNQHPSEIGHALLAADVLREIRVWQRSFGRV
jgi:hypothetical protein